MRAHNVLLSFCLELLLLIAKHNLFGADTNKVHVNRSFGLHPLFQARVFKETGNNKDLFGCHFPNEVSACYKAMS